MPNEQPDQLSIDDSGPRVRLAVPAMTARACVAGRAYPYCHAHTRRRSIAAKQIRGIRFIRCEPPILKQNLSTDRSAPDAPGDAVARLEKKLEEAKGDASASPVCLEQSGKGREPFSQFTYVFWKKWKQ